MKSRVSLSVRLRRGSYEYRVRYTDEIGKHHEKAHGGFKKKREAENEGRLIVRKIEDGFNPSNNYTVESYLNFWEKTYKEGKVQHNTITSIKVAIKFLSEECGNIKLQNFNKVMYQQFLNKSLEKHESSTMQTYHQKYREAFKRALVLGFISENPTDDAVITKKRTNRQKKMILEYEEIPKFYESLKQESIMYQTFFILDLNTGMRYGEIADLEWSDIENLFDDLHKTLIRVNKALIRVTNPNLFPEFVSSTPKTESGYRIIDVDRYTTSFLEMLKQAESHSIVSNLNKVFYTKRGLPISVTTANGKLKQICERAEIESISIHKLRHTHCVMEIDSGADISYVSKRLGHASPSITWDVYHHCSNHIKNKSIGQFEQFLGQIWGTGNGKIKKVPS